MSRPNQITELITLETFVGVNPFETPTAEGTLIQAHKNELRSRATKTKDEVVETTNLMYGSEKDPDNFPDGGTQAYLVLIGAFCGLFTAFGISNSAGAIESYVKNNQLEGVDQTLVSWVFSLHLAILYFGGVFFGPVFDKFGAKKPLLVGTILSTVGLIVVAQLTKLVHFVLSFGLLTALGCLIMMLPSVGAISHWFLRKRALASSIATMGGLVAGSVFGAVLPKLYESIGFDWAIRTMALICFVCLLISVVLVKGRDTMKPAQHEDIPWTTELSAFFRGLLDLSLLANKQFLLLAGASGLAEIVCMSTLTYLSSYAINHGVPFNQANLLITVVNVCGIPARILSGWMADRWGRFNIMFATSILSTIVIFALWFPAKGSVAFLYVFGVLFGIFTSAIVLLIPACAGQICSADQFGKVYGTLYFVLAFVMMIGMYLASVVISKGSQVDYSHLVLYEGGLGAGSAVAWLLARWLVVGWKWCKF